MSARLPVSLLTTIGLLFCSAVAASPQIRSNEALVLARQDGSGMVLVAADDPRIRFAEVAGERALVRVTPIDGDGAAIGSGGLVVVLPNEQREMRLRDEFASDLLRTAHLRVEVLEGRGVVTVSSAEEYGWTLKSQAEGASRRRAVSPGPAAQPSSLALIDNAEAAGTLSSETALLYRVYALFSDARLPGQYRGDDSALNDSTYMTEVRDRLDQLSPETQALLLPFFAPPAYKGSWANSRTGVPSVSATPPPCEFFADNWAYVDAINSPVRIWYRVDLPDALQASRMATFIDTTVWTKLTGLMKRSPMTDESQSCNGGNGRLDIYLTDIARAVIVPYNYCVATPGYILVSRSDNDDTLIHEIFHAFQYAFEMEGCLHREYKWWIEASAQWAIDFVQKDRNGEQSKAKEFLNLPQQPLDFLNDNHEYGAYLIAFYVARKTGDANFVRTAWENCANEPALEAVDHAIPGGFETVWPGFARANWNQDAVKDYRDWDRLYDATRTPEGLYIPVTMAGKQDAVLPIELDLARLSATYKHYKFFGNDVRSVAFWNGAAFKIELKNPSIAGTQYIPSEATEEQKKGVFVRALIKIADQWTEEDWTNRPFVTYCRDVAAERLEELVIIISNSEFKDRSRKLKPAAEKPFVWISNMGCWQWKGTTTYSSVNPYGSVTNSTTVTWTRKGSAEGSSAVTYEASGREKWKIVSHPPPPAPQCDAAGELDITGFYTLTTFNYHPVEGEYHRAYTGAGAIDQLIPACGGQTSLPPWFFPPLPPIVPGIPGARYVLVNSSGTVAKDEYTPPTGGGTWTWNFEAQREP